MFESYEEMVKVARNVLKSGYPLVTSVKAHMLRSSIASDVEIIRTMVITDAADDVQLERYDASCDKVLHAYEVWTDASTSHDFNVANPQLSQVGFSPSELANTILYDVGQNILSVLIRGGASTQLAGNAKIYCSYGITLDTPRRSHDQLGSFAHAGSREARLRDTTVLVVPTIYSKYPQGPHSVNLPVLQRCKFQRHGGLIKRSFIGGTLRAQFHGDRSLSWYLPRSSSP